MHILVGNVLLERWERTTSFILFILDALLRVLRRARRLLLILCFAITGFRGFSHDLHFCCVRV